jgi:ZIP family zinc transporter
MDIDSNVVLALMLTTIAGLSTGIGSVIAYFIKKPKMSYLCFSLGLSGGVMLYVSFVELIPDAFENIGEIWGLYAFFAGLIIVGIIDLFIPDIDNPHHYDKIDKNTLKKAKANGKLMRVGLFTAFAVAIHNFPEGLATLGATLSNVKLGVLITFAVAIHNIPEGISVSMPIYYSTGDRKKAFIYSALSGLSEPLGAIIGLSILLPFLSDWVLGFLLAFVAGIMVYISVDELIPTANQYGHGHCAIMGLIIGMFIMALSLIII